MTAMERPVYYIKGVVRDGAEATQDFVGPLDLILHLLQKNRIAVRDIPLAGQRRAAPPSLEEFRGVVRPAPYRVEEKAAELLSLLRAEGPRRLTDLIRRSGSRSEATATFLALLELCREGKIHLAGEMDNPEVSWRSGT